MNRFVGTIESLAGPEWVKPPHLVEAIQENRRLRAFRKQKQQRGFCPNGAGGGVTNTCSSQEKMAADDGANITGGGSYDRPKTLEQERLEAAGTWGQEEWDSYVESPYDGGDNDGYVPDLHISVSIPGLPNQKTMINIDDPEQVAQYITLSAKSMKMTPEDFMKSKKFGGSLYATTPSDKAKLFGGSQKRYEVKIHRSGGWGNKENDDAAKRIGSILRAAGIRGDHLADAVREHAKKKGTDAKDEMYSGLTIFKRDPYEFIDWVRERMDGFDPKKYKKSKRSYDELVAFLAARRGFCPTGEGGGVDNSCGASSSGGESSSGGSSSGTSKVAAKVTPAAARRSVTPKDIAKILEKIGQNPDGFTLDPASSEQPPDGIMVSEYKNDSVRSVKIKASDIGNATGADAFAKWYAENVDLLIGDPSKFIGGWKTGDDFYIDVATRFDPDKAEAALEAGRKAGQLAVFNLATFKETWVKYEDGDSRKPPEWDKAFQRARKDSVATQVYEETAPGFDEEDWDSELTKHGKTTVRAYNTSREEHRNGKQQQGRTVRHSVEGNNDRGLQSVPNVSGGFDRPSVEGVVRGQSRAAAVPVQGSAASSGREATASARILASQAEAVSRHLWSLLPSVEYRGVSTLSPVVFSPESDTIYVSPDISDSDVSSFRELAEDGWFSQPNPVLHEHAKRYHYLKSRESYSRSLTLQLTSEQRSLVSKSVSGFAATSASAFVAEYVAGRLSGYAYSKQVKELISEVTDGEIVL